MSKSAPPSVPTTILPLSDRCSDTFPRNLPPGVSPDPPEAVVLNLRCKQKPSWGPCKNVGEGPLPAEGSRVFSHVAKTGHHGSTAPSSLEKDQVPHAWLVDPFLAHCYPAVRVSPGQGLPWIGHSKDQQGLSSQFNRG